jgi:hypothetical protein
VVNDPFGSKVRYNTSIFYLTRGELREQRGTTLGESHDLGTVNSGHAPKGVPIAPLRQTNRYIDNAGP